jgi:hypothetical protein
MVKYKLRSTHHTHKFEAIPIKTVRTNNSERNTKVILKRKITYLLCISTDSLKKKKGADNSKRDSQLIK